MKRVYMADDPIFVGFVRSVLEENGVECVIRNEFLRGAMGELPPTDCWPEIWIIKDDDEDRANTLIEEAIGNAT